MNQTIPVVSPQFIRSRIGKVCVAIIGSTPAEMLEKAQETIRENTFLEFRLDYLDKPLAAIPKLRQFLADRADVTAIATCRRAAAGGKFKGKIAEELEVLNKAAAAGFHLVDVELQTAENVKEAELEKLRARGAAIIISWHDFTATKDLDGIFERIRPFDPDFVKIVSTAKNLSDNVTMMHFLERTRDMANMIGICMGDQGIISRVLAIRAGSVFTFAAATPGEETGPGQIAARTLRETYRIDQIDAATRVYGVAGNPIKHSLSPLMLNTAFRRETVNAVFLALQATKLKDLLTLVREVPIHGLAVTMPLKEEILEYLEKTDAISEKIGACNTVVRAQDGKLYGFNTDVAAVVRPLERRLQLNGAKVLVLGAGGAARAAVFGLKEKGAEVFILNRTAADGQKLARQAKARTFRRDQLAKTQFDVIINATPVGMQGVKPNHILEPKEINARLVFDMVYNPIETPLLRMAREKGVPVVTGVEMFVHQGARQFEIWTGKPAPEEEMFRVVVHALRQRSEEAAKTGKA
ncbi:shikimate dehydrogenase [Pseudacidobacterium ailaaui]|jgi:3-dehydroquinate dehydratase/shikimate dehydrogenase|uniref:shikimate dehydrogenase n=1 Tax=Pseudacidobacterium ailaaui TaxID=1382359 RepID=UPI0005D1B51C|nr:shikimate dehydrogenase [Pseudacidobacterium ailaaui]MCL6462887.1 shikimate dehydrogenase [Pseudacidobacterium ailaaui]MDI3254641.1 shikimate dehydrogenase [Bacillota bacterium]